MDYKIKKAPNCPECGQKMKKWRVPEDSTWNEEFHYVCFNDECPYYVRGWDWMKEKYQHRASYRWRINPSDGTGGPLPVWTAEAHKEYLLPDDEED